MASKANHLKQVVAHLTTVTRVAQLEAMHDTCYEYWRRTGQELAAGKL